MASTSSPASAHRPAATSRAVDEQPVASFSARASAYVIDSALLLLFLLIFLIIAGSVLLFASDLGKEDASDAAYYASLAVFIGGSLITWSLFNIAVTWWRRQTAGMYVIGLLTVSADEEGLPLGRATLRWIAFHPLLFHPFLVPVWASLAFLIVSLTLSKVVLAIAIALVLLCLVAPFVGLASALLDDDRRALHDRLAGTLVIHLPER
jgi:uncharacterized RDD family membrane protein YckC